MFKNSYKKPLAESKFISASRKPLATLGLCCLALFVVWAVTVAQEVVGGDTNTPTPCSDFAWMGVGTTEGPTTMYRANFDSNKKLFFSPLDTANASKGASSLKTIEGSVPSADGGPVGTNKQVNAIGYSYDDGFFYGMTPDNSKGRAGQIFRIASDGHGYLMGWGTDVSKGQGDKNKTPELPEPGTTIQGPSYFAGDVRSKALPDVDGKAANGYLYTFNLDDTNPNDGDTHFIFAVKIDAKDTNGKQVAKLIDISPGNTFPDGSAGAQFTDGLKIHGSAGNSRDLAINDWSFSPVDGKLYGYDSNKNRIVRINPETGGIQPMSNSSLGPYKNKTVAGTWFDSRNNFYLYQLGGNLIKFKTNSNGSMSGRVKVGNARPSDKAFTRGDGAGCPFLVFEKDVADESGNKITPPGVPTGSKVKYTYTIGNIAHKQMKGNFIDDMERYGSNGRKFIAASVSIDGFSNNPEPTITDTKLTIPNFTIPKNSTAKVTIMVQTNPDEESDEPYLDLLNQAKLTDVTVGDNAPVGDRDSDWPQTEQSGDPTHLYLKPLTNIPRDKPYLKVYGNDISAGSGFYEGDTCYSNGSSDISAYSKQSSGDWVGSSGQLGVFATGNISGLFSAGMRNNKTGDSARPFTGLTFGNYDGTSILPTSGGQTELRCISDYYKLAEDGGATKLTDDSITGRSVDDGEHKVEYIDGNVTISGNVLYDNDGGWTDLTQIPSYTLIVRGNIYIRNNVTRLDGMFIAQPRIDGGTINTNTGNIYTCTVGGDSGDGNTSPAAASDCDKKLTINGAFIARQVRFLRTRGDINTDATSDEGPDNKMAEVFNFSQDMYLAPLGSSLRRTVPYQHYDYITSLPPVL